MKQVRYIVLAVIIIAAVVFYLNRTYAFIYAHISRVNLLGPYMQQNTTIKSQIPKAKAVKYVALGDSLSAGVGTDNNQESFPYLLAKKMSQNFEVNLVNLGVPGAKSSDVLNQQVDKAIAQKPDYITLLIGINDIHGLILAKNFESNFSQIVNQLATRTKAKITIINIPYLGADNLILPPYNLYFDRETVKFNRIIQTITDQKSLCYVDLYQLSKNAFAKNRIFYSADWFHPSANGYQFWTEVIYANSSCLAN